MILIDLVPQLSHLFHLNANSFREDFCSWGPCSWSLFRRAWGSKSKLPTGPPPSAFPPLILWLLVVAAAARFGHDIEFLSMLEDPMEAVTVNTFWHIRVESTLNLHQVIHANRRRTSHYFSLCPCLSLSLFSLPSLSLSSLFSLLSSLFSLLSLLSLPLSASLCLSLPLSASLSSCSWVLKAERLQAENVFSNIFSMLQVHAPCHPVQVGRGGAHRHQCLPGLHGLPGCRRSIDKRLPRGLWQECNERRNQGNCPGNKGLDEVKICYDHERVLFAHVWFWHSRDFPSGFAERNHRFRMSRPHVPASWDSLVGLNCAQLISTQHSILNMQDVWYGFRPRNKCNQSIRICRISERIAAAPVSKNIQKWSLCISTSRTPHYGTSSFKTHNSQQWRTSRGWSILWLLLSLRGQHAPRPPPPQFDWQILAGRNQASFLHQFR